MSPIGWIAIAAAALALAFVLKNALTKGAPGETEAAE